MQHQQAREMVSGACRPGSWRCQAHLAQGCALRCWGWMGCACAGHLIPPAAHSRRVPLSAPARARIDVYMDAHGCTWMQQSSAASMLSAGCCRMPWHACADACRAVCQSVHILPGAHCFANASPAPQRIPWVVLHAVAANAMLSCQCTVHKRTGNACRGLHLYALAAYVPHKPMHAQRKGRQV